ncbi:silent information regulator protein Sir2 [Tribonema minus]|uniref:NAD-dependent protein deacylase n=1 Tax=Tribonema minus TaxID=303371 RepID=A0A835YXH7_9STRA|nr:silent information regulator protein Sir2 [Tribonema minus]
MTSAATIEHLEVADASAKLHQWLSGIPGPVVALTGAGISTDSGIPDYRGPNGSYSRGHKPMKHDEFMGSHRNRQRYWSRSTVGWQWFSAARPNDAHRALAALEAAGKISGVITQNVDMLHQRAGSAAVVDLHGVNSRVVCMGCGATAPRHALQAQLAARNAAWLEALSAVDGGLSAAARRADGDVDVEVEGFELCDCEACGGVLKPDVVFFGDNVPQARVRQCFDMVAAADGLLVVGSSLAVYSGFRFVEAAVKQGKPVAILNQGPTRAEKAGLPILKLEAGCSAVLRAVAQEWPRQDLILQNGVVNSS